MRDKLLNEAVFTSMAQARAVIAAWAADCNTARPHAALGYQTPAAHAPIAQTAPDGVTLQSAG